MMRYIIHMCTPRRDGRPPYQDSSKNCNKGVISLRSESWQEDCIPTPPRPITQVVPSGAMSTFQRRGRRRVPRHEAAWCTSHLVGGQWAGKTPPRPTPTLLLEPRTPVDEDGVHDRDAAPVLHERGEGENSETWTNRC